MTVLWLITMFLFYIISHEVVLEDNLYIREQILTYDGKLCQK